MKFSPGYRFIFPALLVSLLLTACARGPQVESPVQSAETVLYNGRVYTPGGAQLWQEAVAIRDGKYIFVGADAEANAYVGESTLELDLGGAMVMPGINDGHSHPWQGGVKALYQCTFDFDATPDDIAARLRACVRDNPDAQWIIGGQWTSDFFRNQDIGSPREWLDAISSDKVIYLNDDATHNAWVNSRALEMAGITADTPDPEGGTIVRDANGEPNGLLYEHARRSVYSLRPPLTVAQYKAGIVEALRQANSFGLTGVNEARVTEEALQAYAELDAAGELNVRVTVNLQTPREYRDYPLNAGDYLALRDRYPLDRVNAGYVKIFLDGVPTASRTAYMLQDYLTDEQHPEATRGFLLVSPEALAQDMVALDKAGFTVKLHAAGDGSVRVALDAIEAARKANGNSGLRHELAHAGFIDPQDLPRFATLNVTADLSPYLWYPSPIIDSIEGALGERGAQYWPVKDLLDSGADVLVGSDWPSAAKDLSPWHAIEALVTRRNPFTDQGEAHWPAQAISLEQALAIVTIGGARALLIEDRSGAIETGKSADLIVLDQNLFEVPPQQISETQVVETWLQGERVYQRQIQ
jgi:predicted amidohydrolase YtcJ